MSNLTGVVTISGVLDPTKALYELGLNANDKVTGPIDRKSHRTSRFEGIGSSSLTWRVSCAVDWYLLPSSTPRIAPLALHLCVCQFLSWCDGL